MSEWPKKRPREEVAEEKRKLSVSPSPGVVAPDDIMHLGPGQVFFSAESRLPRGIPATPQIWAFILRRYGAFISIHGHGHGHCNSHASANSLMLNYTTSTVHCLHL